ncbi:MAG TPA: hypothetical protein VGR18_12130 [Rubrobacter sp.]|nr:hypothetical protein [Rubrobacter sp.]
MARARRAETEIQAGSVYWLICDGTESSRAFVLDLAGLGPSLPVFSYREEAELFLALGGLDGRWAVREGGTGDFLSLFFGPHTNLKSVVLDPLPAMLREGVAGLVSLSSDRFMDRFLGISGPGALPG